MGFYGAQDGLMIRSLGILIARDSCLNYIDLGYLEASDGSNLTESE